MERIIDERQIIIFDTARVWVSLKFYACAKYTLSLRSLDAAELMISKYGHWITELGVATRRHFTRAVNVGGVWRYSIDKVMWRNAVSEDDYLLLHKMKETYILHFSDSSRLLATDEDAMTEPYDSESVADDSIVFNDL